MYILDVVFCNGIKAFFVEKNILLSRTNLCKSIFFLIYLLMTISVSFAQEKLNIKDACNSFYALDFPNNNIDFWRSISQHIAHMRFDNVLKKLQSVNELSDNSLSLLEFRAYMSIKLICLLESGRKDKSIEYLDTLVNFTRKSKRYQNEIFVNEYFFSLYYAFLEDYKKSKDSLDKFISHLAKSDEWRRWYRIEDILGIYYYAACVSARMGNFEDAIKYCDRVLILDTTSSKYATNKEVLKDFYTRFDINLEQFKIIINEVKEKRQIFATKKVFIDKCKLAYVPLTSNDLLDTTSDQDKFCGLAAYFYWEKELEIVKNHVEKNTFPAQSPALVRWILKLPEVIVTNSTLFRSIENACPRNDSRLPVR
jgi:tetratricopeptide (TPR) repeat protein